MPDAKIVVCNLYNNSESEYNDHEKISGADDLFYLQTKYPKTNSLPLDASIHDEKDRKGRYITSGFRNSNNPNFFTEGFNIGYEYFKDEKSKVLMLAEDHYFTNGKTLKELNDNEWDFAYAQLGLKPHWMNASIIGFIPSKYYNIFPLNVYAHLYDSFYIERHLDNVLFSKLDKSFKKYIIQNRKDFDYKGDGQYTNSSDVIELDLKKVGII